MRKFFVALIGGTVVLLGLAMLILPGPGMLVVTAGVAILATEFIWARRVWRKAKCAVARARREFGLRDWLRRIKASRNQKIERAELGGDHWVRASECPGCFVESERGGSRHGVPG